MGKQPKLITCKHCGQEIAASAKTCPHCGGKNRKPIYKKVWFWILIVLVLFGAIGGGSGNKKTSTSKKVGEVSTSQTIVSKEKEETKAGENIQTVFNVGDILHDGNMDIVYVASGDYEESNEFIKPADGKKYIFLNFAFINTSDKSDSSISTFSFKCYADGYSCDAYYGAGDDLSATLSAGRSTQGNVYFEVPADAKDIEIEYETNVFTQEKITFAFEGEKDSGYVPEKNTTTTPGAIKIGEKVESKYLNVTYLECHADESNNMFIMPKAGHHYITCEFEFENPSKSDIVVSYFSFDCYADGLNCDGAYFRDDAISATLSSGRRAKGTVTFEVPDNASVVEVEYLANFWTSNRVVFDASGK